MPTRKQIHGAKWWKFDFHTHTPVSNDFGKGDATLQLMLPREWLLMFMKAEIDCVAVTDHNSGEWVDKLKIALNELKLENAIGYRPLYIFPGVEISVSTNCHVLAIFDTSSGSREVTTLLGSLGFPSEHFGTSDTVTEKSITDVLEVIIKAGAIAIPAHVDKACGLFDRIKGTTLTQALQVEGLLAIELIDKSYIKPDIYTKSKLALTEVVGTDTHIPAQVGTNYTWVKMHEPSLDALRLALHDGEDGVIRMEEISTDPNMVLNRYFIKSIYVKEAYKAGRTLPLIANFSPWLSSIIGGRGCGKSSLINFLRLVFCRHCDMPEAIQDDFNLFKKLGTREGSGMLTQDTVIKVEIRKDANLYAITWSSKDDVFHFQEWDEANGVWSNPTTVTNVVDLFPIQVFSQKELYALTTDPSKLIELIDSQFEKETWKFEKDALINRWLLSRLRARELNKLINEEKNLETQLGSVASRIKLYESSDFKETLSAFNFSSTVNNFFNNKSDEIEGFIDKVEDLGTKIPDMTVPDNFETGLDEASLGLIGKWSSDMELIDKKIKEVQLILASYKGRTYQYAVQMPWKQKFDESKAAYNLIIDKIKALGSDSYESLIQKQDELIQKIDRLKSFKNELVELKNLTSELYTKIIDHEKKLRILRQQVVDRWKHVGNTDNSFLIVELRHMCNSFEANKTFRELIRKPGEEFSKYIFSYNELDEKNEGLLAELISDDGNKWNKREEIIKRLIEATEVDQKGFERRLVKHIQNLRENTPEDIDRLLIWVPEDEIILKFMKEGSPQDIQSGSAGERVAGMLGLLLALNDVPLIVDQPEDDLDTRLISNFVVPSFRKLKLSRQLIFVTHNPNIAVNANSDNIIHMNFHAGQIVVAGNNALQDRDIRLAVCDVMEGGKEALNKRYYRISKALKI